MKTKEIIQHIKSSEEDFEWYPTTNEILNVVKNNIGKHFSDYNGKMGHISVLDCGAGDGRSLKELSFGGDMFAIEKSEILRNLLSEDIFVVGTDFDTSTLIDKKVDVLFCNPPYSEFESWSTKIIREANAVMIYLVIPTRWKNSTDIEEALKLRKADVENLGTFDFLNSDRQARAVVDILAVKLYNNLYRHSAKYCQIDPFDLWFNSQFNFDRSNDHIKEETVHTKLQNEIVQGGGVIPSLVKLYNFDMSKLQNNYLSVTHLDTDILKELGVKVEAIKVGLKEKIKGLKTKYWQELFENYHPITSRLDTRSRKEMEDKLSSNTSVDFTVSNAYALTEWAIKNSNKYFDIQLIRLVEGMISSANISLYKSNQRTFGREEWRYLRKPDGLNRYGLELRVVLSNKGGTQSSGNYSSWEYPNNLNRIAHDFLNDILAVANNLGYNSFDTSKSFEWESGSKNIFSMADGFLMEVKAYMNGNIHIKFNKNFLRHLNVEFGRLKGWIKDKSEASEELNIPINEVEKFFNTNLKIEHSNILLLTENPNNAH